MGEFGKYFDAYSRVFNDCADSLCQVSTRRFHQRTHKFYDLIYDKIWLIMSYELFLKVI